MNSQIFNVECITSKSNSTVIKVSKLTQKKNRKEEHIFTLDGIKLFEEAYKFCADISMVILNDGVSFDENIVDKIKSLKNNGTQIICVSDSVFAKLTEESAPQGIITVCNFLKIHSYCDVSDCHEKERIIVFESIRDPGNIGGILRNAAAFGIDRLIFSSDCADIYSQKVIRASMGAIFKVKIDIVDNLKGTVEELKRCGKRVVSTTLRENSLVLGKSKISTKDVFIIGNEGHGISEEIICASDETMIIPMCKNTESLNASVAAAILMWELFKL